MNYLRERILEPILIPLLAIGLIGFGVLNFSRFFLATGGMKAVLVATLITLTILMGATLATSREEPISRGTLLGGMAILGLVLSSAGLLAQEVDLDHVAADDEPPGGAAVSSAVDVTAVDIDFVEKELEASPGNIQFNYVNEGQTVHTLVVEGFEDQMKLEVPANGATDSGQLELEANGYTYYCDVPGHREAGMEGTLTVEEGLGTAPAGGGAGGGEPAISVPAVDIDFPEKEFSAAPGEVTIEYVNEGQSPHTLVIEGREEDLVLEVASNGDTDVGSIELEAGTYTLYCDIPGHREAGMEGTLTVAEGGGGGGGGPPADEGGDQPAEDGGG